MHLQKYNHYFAFGSELSGQGEDPTAWLVQSCVIRFLINNPNVRTGLSFRVRYGETDQMAYVYYGQYTIIGELEEGELYEI